MHEKLIVLVNQAVDKMLEESKQREIDVFDVYKERLGTIVKMMEVKRNGRQAICN